MLSMKEALGALRAHGRALVPPLQVPKPASSQVRLPSKVCTCEHTHTCVDAHMCVHKPHPTCVHANTPYVCYRLRDADIPEAHTYTPSTVPSACTHVHAPRNISHSPMF